MGAWQSHDNRAAYFDLGVGNGAQVEAQAQREAANRGWQFDRLTSNMTLIRRLLDGEWDQDSWSSSRANRSPCPTMRR